MINLLTFLYDNPPVLQQNRRTGNRQLNIIGPTINILGGCTPGYLATTFPEGAWTMGFSSRMVMVYHSGAAPKVPLFSAPKLNPERQIWLQTAMAKMTEMVGECIWDDDVAMTMERWALIDCPPVPEHSKLQTYNGRRHVNLVKLCMISAASSGRLRVMAEDLKRAQDWLIHAEAKMPDIFRDMVHRSDHDILNELHYYMYKRWLKDKKPLHESSLYHFLQTKVASDKIPRIIDIAQRSSMIARMEGTDLWIPKPKHEHGEE